MSKKYNINIDVIPHYIESQSAPEKNRYFFTYTITIQNTGSVAAKLLSRHWLVTDSNGKVQDVKGEGVVGEQPYLNPGDSYSYTSGAMTETDVAVMEGKYFMRADDGKKFDVSIPRFTLSIPRIIH